MRVIELVPYRECVLDSLDVDADAVLSGSLDSELVRRASLIISEEAPITRELLVKRLLNSVGLFKCGCRLDGHLTPLLDSLEPHCVDECGVIVHHSETERPFTLRTGMKEFLYSHQIAPSEATMAIIIPLQESTRKLRKKELYPLFIRTLDYQKRGSDLEELFSRALRYGQEKGWLVKSTSSTWSVSPDF